MASAIHRYTLLLALLLALPGAPSKPSAAQTAQDASAYPTRPIRLVVPFPSGASPNDIIGRLIGRQLAESMGQQVIVDKETAPSRISRAKC